MLALAIRYWQIGLGGLMGAIVAFGLHSFYVTAVSLPAARQEGREIERTAALERSIELIRERSATDEEIGRMSDGELCRALGGSVQPDGRCE